MNTHCLAKFIMNHYSDCTTPRNPKSKKAYVAYLTELANLLVKFNY